MLRHRSSLVVRIFSLSLPISLFTLLSLSSMTAIAGNFMSSEKQESTSFSSSPSPTPIRIKSASTTYRCGPIEVTKTASRTTVMQGQVKTLEFPPKAPGPIAMMIPSTGPSVTFSQSAGATYTEGQTFGNVTARVDGNLCNYQVGPVSLKMGPTATVMLDGTFDEKSNLNGATTGLIGGQITANCGGAEDKIECGIGIHTTNKEGSSPQLVVYHANTITVLGSSVRQETEYSIRPAPSQNDDESESAYPSARASADEIENLMKTFD